MQVAWVRSLGGDPICLMVLPNPHQKRTSYFHTWVVKIISFKKLLIHTHHTGITFSFPEHHKHIGHFRFADLPNSGIEPTSLTSLALQADSLELGHGGSPKQLERSYEKVWRVINDRSGSFLIWSNGGNEMSLKAIFLVFQRVPGKQKHLPPQQTPAESHLRSPLVSRQLLGAAEANEHSGEIPVILQQKCSGLRKGTQQEGWHHWEEWKSKPRSGRGSISHQVGSCTIYFYA